MENVILDRQANQKLTMIQRLQCFMATQIFTSAMTNGPAKIGIDKKTALLYNDTMTTVKAFL